MQKAVFVFLFLFSIFSGVKLNAEIDEVVMRWNALQCLNVCIPTLEQQLRNIENVSDLQFSPRSGVAVLRWKPNYPFSYQPFNLATRSIGIRLSDFRVRVRGTINNQQDNYYIVSSGDNTSFLLLGPIRAEPGRYTIQWNISSHPLSPELRSRLSQAAVDRTIVEIEGPLFEPNRFLLMLIVEQLKFPKEDEMNPRYR